MHEKSMREKEYGNKIIIINIIIIEILETVNKYCKLFWFLTVLTIVIKFGKRTTFSVVFSLNKNQNLNSRLTIMS